MMPSDEPVYTAETAAYQAARMQLEVGGVLGIDDGVDADGLVGGLVERGWQVGLDQERPLELPAAYVVATRDGVRHAFWADQVEVGLVLALAAAVREDDPLMSRRDEGGLIW